MNQRKKAIERVRQESKLISQPENFVTAVEQIINNLCDYIEIKLNSVYGDIKNVDSINSARDTIKQLRDNIF